MVGASQDTCELQEYIMKAIGEPCKREIARHILVLPCVWSKQSILLKRFKRKASNSTPNNTRKRHRFRFRFKQG